MKNKEPKKRSWETVTYTDNPELPDIEDLEIVSDDFLPRPEELVFRPKGVKVTITLSENSLTFFKKKARQLDTSYQRMIRNLLDEYVRHIKQA